MSIPAILPSSASVEILAKIDTRSQKFYEAVIKGEKLKKLRPWAEICKRDLYQSLSSFFKKKKVTLGPPQLCELVQILQNLKNLQKVYTEMQVQERRLLIQMIRKIGSKPIVSAIAFTLTAILTAYTAMAFGIIPIFHREYPILFFTLSGITGIFIFALLTLSFELCRNYYEKVKIGEYDLLEREFFFKYFENFGILEFEQCKKLIKEMDPNLMHPIDYTCRDNLLTLADHCQKYKLLLDNSRVDTHPLDSTYFNTYFENIDNVEYVNPLDPDSSPDSSRPVTPLNILERLNLQLSGQDLINNPPLTSQASQYFQVFMLSDDDKEKSEEIKF